MHLQLSKYFLFFAFINNYFLMNNQTVVLSGVLSEKPRKFLKEVLSIHCFSSSKSERPYNCCKKVFNHNDYFSFISASENRFVKIYKLKNDKKRFSIDQGVNFSKFVSNLLKTFIFFFKSKISKSFHE